MPLPLRSHTAAELAGQSPAVNVGSVERAVSLLFGGMLLLNGMGRRDTAGAAQALVGVVLAGRGATGRCPVFHSLGVSTAATAGDAAAIPVRKLVLVRKSFTIERSPEELFALWRRLENLPSFMEHLESVTELDATRSRWVASGPLGRKLEWEAEITAEEPGRALAWRSIEGSSIANSGSVRFDPAPGERGTEVRVSMEYAPPAGAAGDVVAKLLGNSPERLLQEDLRHFKQFAEAGEVPTTDGQPRG
ncbi:MAG: SRPBCC family protein [Gemmatimonadota bacterium]